MNEFVSLANNNIHIESIYLTWYPKLFACKETLTLESIFIFLFISGEAAIRRLARHHRNFFTYVFCMAKTSLWKSNDQF